MKLFFLARQGSTDDNAKRQRGPFHDLYKYFCVWQCGICVSAIAQVEIRCITRLVLDSDMSMSATAGTAKLFVSGCRGC